MPANSGMKRCARCGTEFMPRRRYLRNWHAVKFCSRACALGGRKTQSLEFEKTIVDMLDDLQPGAFLRPAEVAMHLAGEDGEWRPLLEDVVRAARRLAHREQVTLLDQPDMIGSGELEALRMERGPAFDPTPWQSSEEEDYPY